MNVQVDSHGGRELGSNVVVITDHVAVLRGGRLVEVAPSGRFFTHPEHPYSRALLEAVPRIVKESK